MRTISNHTFWRLWTGLILTISLFSPLLTHGQEALRASLAGEAAAEARKRQLENNLYNLMIGQMKVRVWGGMEVEATDNVNLSNQHPEADLSMSPRLDLAANWVVTEQNTLSFSAGIGYTTFLQHQELNHLFITPDTDLAFNIYAGNFLINLHNRFQILQQASSQPQISQTSQYGYYQNSAGATVTWDLNKVILIFNYDHDIQAFFPDTFSFQDHSSELFQTRAAWLYNNLSQLGLELGGGLTTYNQHPTNGSSLSDLKYYNFGPYFQSQITRHINLKLSSGYTAYTLESPNSFGESGTIAAYYVDFALTHQLNDKVKYQLFLGRQIQLGVYSSTLDLMFARLNPIWRIIRNTDLSTPLYFEHAKQAGTRGETVRRFGGGLQLTYQMSSKLTTSAAYYYLSHDSDLSDQDYTQNRLVLDLQYRF